MKFEQYKDMHDRFGTARIFDEVPEIESLDISEKRDYFIGCVKMPFSQARNYDDGFYTFYKITKFCGRTMPILNEDDTIEDSCETFIIAVWNNYND